ncbi:hypothetical protein WJX73_000400 [Symbiochloris irregularis]|uniref:F-box domain-containing protein n=1 Tax=Symbiochloris irregularis TaxID=706552 RepID=A0AAW1NNT3_9CHLO
MTAEGWESYSACDRWKRQGMADDRQLLSLPDGVICTISSLLDFQSKVSCELVNRRLYDLLNRPGLWQRFHVTLEQLLESVDSQPIRPASTPAAR